MHSYYLLPNIAQIDSTNYSSVALKILSKNSKTIIHAIFMEKLTFFSSKEEFDYENMRDISSMQ